MSISSLELIDRASNMSLASILKGGIGGWFLGVFAGVTTGTQELIQFLFLPFTVLTEVGIVAARELFIRPLGLVQFGVRISGEKLVLFDVLALPFAVAIALAAVGVAVIFLSFGPTSNVLVGTVLDNPLARFFFTTPEEEAEEE